MVRRVSLVLALFALPLATACHRGADASTTADGRGDGVQVSIQDGRLVFTDSIRFEFDSAQLAEGSTAVLDAIASFLSAHSGITSVRIEGHTDAHGADDHNQTLSNARAQAVADYLRGHGVSQELAVEGFGASRPVCEETSDECDARNRRVDFIVVGE